jgi:regulator of sirC expression with transglutaminase-like and TPR domain
MFKQHEAIIRLLKDDDPGTVLLTKRQLASGGLDTISDLRDLLELNDDAVSIHVQEILSEIEVRDAKNRFTHLCSTIRSIGHLEEACWLLAQIFLPGIDVAPYIRQFDKWGAALVERNHAGLTASERVALITDFLANEWGLRGNTEDYYSLSNSLLPSVIDSKLGIPISLSVIYIIIGHRCDLPINGLNLPGHFVVSHENVVFDPFYQGRILSTQDCAVILAQQSISLTSDHLEPATPGRILMRILANILHVLDSIEEDDLQKQIRIWIQILEECRQIK